MKAKDTVRRLGNATLTVLFFALFLCSANSGFAQVTASGALGGTVVDKNGALIKGATVTVTNKATGQTQTATPETNDKYNNNLLSPITYDVKSTATISV